MSFPSQFFRVQRAWSLLFYAKWSLDDTVSLNKLQTCIHIELGLYNAQRQKVPIRVTRRLLNSENFFTLLCKIYHFECDRRLCDWLRRAVPTARVESIHCAVTKTICARPRPSGIYAKAAYVFISNVLAYPTWSLTEERAFVEVVGFPVSARNHLLGRNVFFSAFVIKLRDTRFHNSYTDVVIEFVGSWAWFSRRPRSILLHNAGCVDKRFLVYFTPQAERLGCCLESGHGL
jgi:hypothetical protein